MEVLVEIGAGEVDGPWSVTLTLVSMTEKILMLYSLQQQSTTFVLESYISDVLVLVLVLASNAPPSRRAPL